MLSEEQLELLILSYGLEKILEDHDIEQEYVLKLLIEEELVDGDRYFGVEEAEGTDG